MSYLAPDYIRRITPYRTGPPADLLRAELGVERLLHLAANENTSGPSPRAVEALAAAAEASHLYPDGGGHHLRHRLAERHRVAPEQVILGNGSAEVVELACRAFIADGQRVVTSRYGFVQYRLSAQVCNAEVVEVAPRPGGRGDDPEGLAAAGHEARLVFIANPNNPTGSHLTRRQLDAYFAAAGEAPLTVVDQAYQEYVDDPDYPDAADDLRAGRNVLVLGTFSKAHGLASLRIGYGLGPPELLAQMECARLPYNTNGLAQAAALAALADADHIAATRRRNRAERAWLAAELTRRGFGVHPSQANFLLVDCPLPADDLFAGLRREGILVCPMRGYGLPGCLRITIGTREENTAVVAALDRLGCPPRGEQAGGAASA